MSAGDVFIIDDTPANLDLLAAILREHDYRVRMASSGRHALSVIRAYPPELVMLDIQMPEMDGFEVCRELKADPATSAIPVLFISALEGVTDKVTAFKTGGVDYVTKPFQAEEVVARVENQLALFRMRRQLEQQNVELTRKNEELMAANLRTDLVFTALSDLLPGTVLDEKYRLEEKIGAGGFGVVYRATHLGLERRVAIKVLRPLPGKEMAEALERFRREGISACRVNHPNAVAVLDSGIASTGIAYLVMELLEGRTLAKELVARGAFSLSRTAEVLEPVCAALSAAHEAGIVHRDVKPDNIFLHRTEGREVVKVVDFGIAKLVGQEEGIELETMTVAGQVFGTPFYTSPERLLCEPYDGRADVYALGVMLYLMLTGEFPYQPPGSQGPVSALLCLTAEPTPLREVNARISPEVERVVLRALSRDPRGRPTARELAQEFRAARAATDSADAGRAAPAGGAPAQAEDTTATLVVSPRTTVEGPDDDPEPAE
jgi:CheY-like chemotaxis protein